MVEREGKQHNDTRESASLNDIFELVRAYAKQETIEPLKGAGRWLVLGSLGSFFIGVGLLVVLIALLRLLQTEVSAFDGAFSWVPYGIVLVVALVMTGFALSRIRRTTLGKEPDR